MIIPTLDEKDRIAEQLNAIRKRSSDRDLEIIVSDGGSRDGTHQEAADAGADQVLLAENVGRAPQMNHGARNATGSLLYFLHADATPPRAFDRWIRSSVEAGYRAGTFRFRFEPMRPWLLWINSFMTRFSWNFVQGGDRSLFVKKSLFDSVGGFDETQVVMEDFEILERIRPNTPFHFIPKAVEVSSRKYRMNGYFRVQYANWKAMKLYRKGTPSHRILQEYKKILHPKTPGY